MGSSRKLAGSGSGGEVWKGARAFRGPTEEVQHLQGSGGQEGGHVPQGGNQDVQGRQGLPGEAQEAEGDPDSPGQGHQREFEKYSGDVRYFAEYQTGLQDFYPGLVEAEEKVTEGLVTPQSLTESENTLSDTRNFQTSLEDLIKVLDNAALIAQKMSHHEHADITVASFRIRWEHTNKSAKLWVRCMEELTGCWADLEGKIDKLTQWVDSSKSGERAQAGLSIDKLEEQL